MSVAISSIILLDSLERSQTIVLLYCSPATFNPNQCILALSCFVPHVCPQERTDAHARGPHPPGIYLRLPHVTFHTRPSPLLTVRTRNDNAAYNAHVSGEAWEQEAIVCICSTYTIFSWTHMHKECVCHYVLVCVCMLYAQEVHIRGKKTFGFQYETRLFVTAVEEASPAAESLLPGDEIVQVSWERGSGL